MYTEFLFENLRIRSHTRKKCI